MTGNYHGAGLGNEDVLDLHGFTVREISDHRLQFFIINHRPPVDPTSGTALDDATSTGSNSTIEIFELDRGSSKLEFTGTIADINIMAPNNIAWSDYGHLLITNDHLSKSKLSYRFLFQYILNKV